jgi:hypothetical protein
MKAYFYGFAPPLRCVPRAAFVPGMTRSGLAGRSDGAEAACQSEAGLGARSPLKPGNGDVSARRNAYPKSCGSQDGIQFSISVAEDVRPWSIPGHNMIRVYRHLVIVADVDRARRTTAPTIFDRGKRLWAIDRHRTLQMSFDLGPSLILKEAVSTSGDRRTLPNKLIGHLPEMICSSQLRAGSRLPLPPKAIGRTPTNTNSMPTRRLSRLACAARLPENFNDSL